MKLKFIRPVIAFCLTITLAFNSVSLAFAAPEDSYDLPLEIQQQQQERLLELLPGFYEKLCSPFDSPLAKKLNNIDIILALKEMQKAEERCLAYMEISDSLYYASMVAQTALKKETIKAKQQELEKGQEQLQKLLEFSTENNQKQLQKALEASLKELKNEKMIQESALNEMQDHQHILKRNIHSNSLVQQLDFAQTTQIYSKNALYHMVKAELPKLVELFYEINNNNDYSSATYAQKKTELLKSLQDIIQELQRQKVEQLQYQCNKQK